jgi:hypothetical protein
MESFKIARQDVIQTVTEPINYNIKNPVLKLMHLMETASVMAEDMSCYIADSFQYLFPFAQLILHGPAGNDRNLLNPESQDNKTDFQKQNVKDFTTTHAFLMRGWVSIGNWTGTFLKLSYLGGPDSTLSQLSGHQLSDHIYVWAKMRGKAMLTPVKVPYNEQTNRYELEIWGYSGDDVLKHLSDKGRTALNRGAILISPDLLPGTMDDFNREGLDSRNMYEVAPENAMHPLLPFDIELAWGDHTKTFWDAQNGSNYHYAFNMIQRGWNQFMEVGVSASPHGGVGFLHYRNLL